MIFQKRSSATSPCPACFILHPMRRKRPAARRATRKPVSRHHSALSVMAAIATPYDQAGTGCCGASERGGAPALIARLAASAPSLGCPGARRLVMLGRRKRVAHRTGSDHGRISLSVRNAERDRVTVVLIDAVELTEQCGRLFRSSFSPYT